MAKIAAPLGVILVVCLVACGGESFKIEETAPVEVAVVEEPTTSTPLPPTVTIEPTSRTPIPSTETPVSPLLSAFDVAMTQDALTTQQPTPTLLTTCSEVNGACLSFTFDGENCTYKGPTDLKPGRTTLILLNESQEATSLGFGRHHEGKTIQDIIDYVETYLTVLDSPSPMPIPDWWQNQRSGSVYPGSHAIWEVYLPPGIHTFICFNGAPFYQNFGTGIVVEE